MSISSEEEEEEEEEDAIWTTAGSCKYSYIQIVINRLLQSNII